MDNSIFDSDFVDKQGRTNIQRMEHIAVHYSKLSITDKSGNINVVYDISDDYQTGICIKLFLGIIFIVVWLINFKKLLLKSKHNNLKI